MHIAIPAATHGDVGSGAIELAGIYSAGIAVEAVKPLEMSEASHDMLAAANTAAAADKDLEKVDETRGATVGTPNHPDTLPVEENEGVKGLEMAEADILAVEKLLDTLLRLLVSDSVLVMEQQKNLSWMALAA